MNKELLYNLEKDKLMPYLKKESFYIKELYRHPEKYNEFKKYIKEKYHLRITDKVSTFVDDLELLSSVISTLN